MSNEKNYILNINGKAVKVASKTGDCLIKYVHRSRHLFRGGNAWGLDYEIYKQAVADGCKYILIKDLETDREYFAELGFFESHGWSHRYGDNRLQLFLGINHFDVRNKNQKEFVW